MVDNDCDAKWRKRTPKLDWEACDEIVAFEKRWIKTIVLIMLATLVACALDFTWVVLLLIAVMLGFIYVYMKLDYRYYKFRASFWCTLSDLLDRGVVFDD